MKLRLALVAVTTALSVLALTSARADAGHPGGAGGPAAAHVASAAR